jgi:hypothetical protein
MMIGNNDHQSIREKMPPEGIRNRFQAKVIPLYGGNQPGIRPTREFSPTPSRKNSQGDERTNQPCRLRLSARSGYRHPSPPWTTYLSLLLGARRCGAS